MNLDNIKERSKDTLKKLIQPAADMLSPKYQPENLNQDAFNTLYERIGLSQFLPYRGYDDDGVWLDDKANNFGSYLFSYEISPIIRAGNDTADAIAELLRSPDLPAGTIIYSIEKATSDVDAYMGAYCVSQKQGHDEMFRRLANYRTNFMTSYAHGEINPLQVDGFRPRAIQYYLVIKVPTSKSKVNEESIKMFSDNVDKIYGLVQNMAKAANIGAKKMSGENLVRLLDQQINPTIKQEDLLSVNYDDGRLNRQFSRTESEINLTRNGYIKFKNTDTNKTVFGAAMTISKYGVKGEPYYIYQTGDATGKTYKTNHYIPGSFVAYSIFEKLDEEQVEIQLNARILKGMEGDKWIEGRAMSFFARKSQEIKESVANLHSQVVDNNYGAVKVISGIILYADSKEELTKNISKAKDCYRDSKLMLAIEKNIAMPMWLNHLPGFFRPNMDGIEKGLCRAVTMNAYNAASMFRVQGDWRGVNPLKGGILSICRKGELSCISPFDVFKSNYNFLLAADSGSGKSFLVNELAKSARSTGGKIRIIDIGRSYEQSCETMQGKNIIFENGKGICINFFSEIFTPEDLKESKETLVSLLADMCLDTDSNSNANPQYKFQTSALDLAITEVWNELGCDMSVKDIRAWLFKAFHGSHDQESELNKMRYSPYVGRQCILDMVANFEPWSNGDYAEWFVGKCNVNFDNDFIVFELEELKAKPELQSVVMNYIIAKIEHEVYLGWKNNTDSLVRKQTYIVIDEAWSLLAKENTARFMEDAARRFRKYEACMGLATQSFLDAGKNSAGRSFCQNVNHIVALKTNIKAVEKAVDEGLIEVEEYQHKWIKSLDKTDDYSEFFWINRSLKSEGLYRFIVDPVTAYIYTSTGQERDMIKSIMSKNKISRMDAIEILANQKVNLDLWAKKRIEH